LKIQLCFKVKQIVDRSANLNIEWNPREIYRQYLQKAETTTGVQTDLKHDATIEEALDLSEVRDILTDNLSTLCTLVESFLNAITSSASSLPYGLRYLSKVLFESLKEKFPEEKEDNLLLSVGNLIYYRFLNPAICAPDAFDVIDLQKGQNTLDSEIRKNLGQIARFLQTAAGSQNSDCSALPAYLNQFDEVIRANQRFSRRFQTFFKVVMKVGEPDDRYGVTEYSEAVEIRKPIVHLTIKDILSTHKLCIEHEETIAPHHADQLHEVLADLKEVPPPEALLAIDTVDADFSELENNSIVLTLQPQTTLTEEQLTLA